MSMILKEISIDPRIITLSFSFIRDSFSTNFIISILVSILSSSNVFSPSLNNVSIIFFSVSCKLTNSYHPYSLQF